MRMGKQVDADVLGYWIQRLRDGSCASEQEKATCESILNILHNLQQPVIGDDMMRDAENGMSKEMGKGRGLKARFERQSDAVKRIFESYAENHKTSKDEENAMRLALAGLEKASQKKPYWDGIALICPTCKRRVGSKDDYCCSCGQRLKEYRGEIGSERKILY